MSNETAATAKTAVFVEADSWDRPVFKCENKFFCLVDVLPGSREELEAAIKKANEGRMAIYTKYGGLDGEPDYPVKPGSVILTLAA